MSQKTCQIHNSFNSPGKEKRGAVKFKNVLRQTNKQQAYFIICAICVELMFCVRMKAQDTMQLKDVQITASRTGFSQVGKNIGKIDSSVKSQFRYNSIADVLNYNSAVHLKSYGPG